MITHELKGALGEEFTISSGKWHTNIKQRYGICITDTESGCGSMIMSGYKNLPSENFSKILEIAIPYLIEDGVGALITTVGQDFPKLKVMLEENGFERLTEYANYRHDYSGNYKQYLYIKKL